MKLSCHRFCVYILMLGAEFCVCIVYQSRTRRYPLSKLASHSKVFAIFCPEFLSIWKGFEIIQVYVCLEPMWSLKQAHSLPVSTSSRSIQFPTTAIWLCSPLAGAFHSKRPAAPTTLIPLPEMPLSPS